MNLQLFSTESEEIKPSSFDIVRDGSFLSMSSIHTRKSFKRNLSIVEAESVNLLICGIFLRCFDIAFNP
jgi:hypothetical protein